MKRAWLVPEVLQTSLMDCGPAALKAVLQGFGIDVHYEWLRDRCQTDVDGTSLDALARLGEELGLSTAEVVVPHDSFLLKEADCLPAIVVKRGANGALHFVVVWRLLGPFVQILDPSGGRRWVHERGFLEDMPYFPIPISAERFRRWIEAPNARLPLLARARKLGARADGALEKALAEPGFRGFAALDAAVRMVTRLVEGGAVARGKEAERLLEGAFERARTGEPGAIPKGFWWATASPAPGKLLVHGAVIVRFAARALVTERPLAAFAERTTSADAPPPAAVAGGQHRSPSALPDGIRRELDRANPSALKLLLQMLRFDAGPGLALILLALVASVGIAALDVLLLRGLFDAVRGVTIGYQRGVGVLVLVAFALGALLLELCVTQSLSRLGRAVELRFRAAFLEKLPRLPDRYLRSRPTSDMTSRAHAMHLLREVPALLSRFARAGLSFAATLIGIFWLYPHGAVLAGAAALLALGVPYLARRPIIESLMRQRTHAGSLERFYLDALIGVVPIRAHGAERSVRREHEALLVEWARTARQVLSQTTTMRAIQALMSTALVVTIVSGYVTSGAPVSGLLLLVFWVFRLPASAQEVVISAVGLRNLQNVALRLFAPLAAAELPMPERRYECDKGRGVSIELSRVTVRAGGHLLLRDVSVQIPAGAHVAIVGASGAGKSSLLSLLLGWLPVSEGELCVDDRVLDAEALAHLRCRTAWVDPGIHLWNSTLFENVTFGHPQEALGHLPRAVGDAELHDLLEKLPEGLQAGLGEGGARVSGGQGQRVRLARALMRNDARLVLLDEPFRGLERERRRLLLARARARFEGATLLFVSHDAADTLDFERVLVVDQGRVVEDGAPRELFRDETSRYRALAESDAVARERVWSGARFRSFCLQRGRLSERTA